MRVKDLQPEQHRMGLEAILKTQTQKLEVYNLVTRLKLKPEIHNKGNWDSASPTMVTISWSGNFGENKKMAHIISCSF